MVMFLVIVVIIVIIVVTYQRCGMIRRVCPSVFCSVIFAHYSTAIQIKSVSHTKPVLENK